MKATVCQLVAKELKTKEVEFQYIGSDGHAYSKPPVIGLTLEQGSDEVRYIRLEMTPKEAARIILHLSRELMNITRE